MNKNMEKYGTDVLSNLIQEETRLMKEMSYLMTSGDKLSSADKIRSVDSQLSLVRNAITELQLEKSED